MTERVKERQLKSACKASQDLVKLLFLQAEQQDESSEGRRWPQTDISPTLLWETAEIIPAEELDVD
jgi:hypothetical protein